MMSNAFNLARQKIIEKYNNLYAEELMRGFSQVPVQQYPIQPANNTVLAPFHASSTINPTASMTEHDSMKLYMELSQMK
jgi:hypothetical protein